MAKNGPKWPRIVQKWSEMIKNWFKNHTKMVQKWSKFVQHWFKNGPKMVINDPKIVRIWSKKGATSPSVMVLSAVYQQLIINSSSDHHQFIVKLGPKNITQIGLRAEGAKANGQRLIHRSINLMISKFNWSHQLCNFVLFIIKLFHVVLVNYDQFCS